MSTKLTCMKPMLGFTKGKEYEATPCSKPGEGWAFINDAGKRHTFNYTGLIFDRGLRKTASR